MHDLQMRKTDYIGLKKTQKLSIKIEKISFISYLLKDDFMVKISRQLEHVYSLVYILKKSVIILC